MLDDGLRFCGSYPGHVIPPLDGCPCAECDCMPAQKQACPEVAKLESEPKGSDGHSLRCDMCKQRGNMAIVRYYDNRKKSR